ncbi:MAG: hypothetical protein QOG57_3879 [Pseudonocardiales bacterium]|nr:hypothetical protein [Pseudonocardiales bacterium]
MRPTSGDSYGESSYNGLARYHDALAAAQRAFADPHELVFSTWAAVELIEAATPSGVPERAAGALERISQSTRASGTDWALGIQALSRALVSEGHAAEDLYRVAIDRLGRTRVRVDLVRAHLLYGESLRRKNRRTDAREQLRTAHQPVRSWTVIDVGAPSVTAPILCIETVQPVGVSILRVPETSRTDADLALHGWWWQGMIRRWR